MAKKLPKPLLGLPSAERIEQSIHVIRGHRVMIDSDLARLYGVATSAVNQAVLRNEERFPEDFSFILTWQEFTDSKITKSCHIKFGPRRPADAAAGLHRAWRRDAFERSPLADGGERQHRDHADLRPLAAFVGDAG